MAKASLSERVSGKTALVTGASSGVGEATAKSLAAHGCRVLCVARRADELERVVGEINGAGGNAEAWPCDLSDLAALDKLASEVLSKHGAVDILINNAGRSIRRSVFAALDRFHDYERTMQINYFAPVKLTLNFLPAMIAQGSGQVVNISSMGTLLSTPRFSAYIGSKSALDGFSRSIGSELAGQGIYVSVVNLPLVRTAMIAPTKQYKKVKALTPEQAASLIEDALTQKAARVTTSMGRVAAAGQALQPRGSRKVGRWLFKRFSDDNERALIKGLRQGN